MAVRRLTLTSFAFGFSFTFFLESFCFITRRLISSFNSVFFGWLCVWGLGRVFGLAVLTEAGRSVGAQNSWKVEANKFLSAFLFLICWLSIQQRLEILLPFRTNQVCATLLFSSASNDLVDWNFVASSPFAVDQTKTIWKEKLFSL